MEEATMLRIQALWDALPTFGAARIDAALVHMLTELMTLIDAQHAYWLGTVKMPDAGPRDPAGGWRARRDWHLPYSSPKREALRKEHLRRIDKGDVDPSIAANLRQAGHFRINIKHEMVTDGWFESEFYKTMLEPLGIRDMIYAVTPLGPDVESWLIFERIGEDKPFFGDAERDLLHTAVRPQKWFHRQLVLHHGILLAETPLTASERQVLNGLLTEKTEKEIAGELHLAASTVHTYCKRICRKFNVRGRAGLIALWLGKTPDQAQE